MSVAKRINHIICYLVAGSVYFLRDVYIKLTGLFTVLKRTNTRITIETETHKDRGHIFYSSAYTLLSGWGHLAVKIANLFLLRLLGSVVRKPYLSSYLLGIRGPAADAITSFEFRLTGAARYLRSFSTELISRITRRVSERLMRRFRDSFMLMRISDCNERVLLVEHKHIYVLMICDIITCGFVCICSMLMNSINENVRLEHMKPV